MRRLALILPALLGACQPGGTDAGAGDPLTPPGVARGAAVDPLLVGDRLMAAGEPELALESYARAAAARGETPAVLGAMAGANIALGRLGQAERQLRDLTEATPRDGRAWNNLGVVLLERGEAGAALRVLETAFALQPSPEILGNLRVATAKASIDGYDGPQGGTFTLTRRDDGVYDLAAPEGRTP